MGDAHEPLGEVQSETVKIVVSPKPVSSRQLILNASPQIKLNQDSMGSVNDTSALSKKLLVVFQQRKELRAYKPGMETRTDVPEQDRIERTVFIKAPRALRYEEVVKVIDAIKGAGANPVGLQVDDLPQ